MTETADVQTFTIDGFDIEVTYDGHCDRLTVTLVHDNNAASNVDMQVAAVSKAIRQWREAVTVIPTQGRVYEYNDQQWMCTDEGHLVCLSGGDGISGKLWHRETQPRFTTLDFKEVVMSMRIATPVHGPYALGGLYHPTASPQSTTDVWRRIDGGWALIGPDNTVAATYTDETFGDMPMTPVERIN